MTFPLPRPKFFAPPKILWILWILCLLTAILNCSGTRPADIGVRENGRLKPCPPSPNCVTSFCDPKDQEHYYPPIAFSGSKSEAKQKLIRVIQGQPRTKIIQDQENYLHVEYTSLLWRFVDDVEFLFDEKNSLIHLRSASRLGKGDLGVNRKRIQSIQNELGW